MVRKTHIAVIVVIVIVAFVIGILIGYFGMMKPASKEQDEKPKCKEEDKKADLQKRREEMMSYHIKFQTTVSEEQLENNLKHFSEKPHIAGSARQKVLADELARRWKDENGFDKVEMPEYQALLSKPNTVNRTTITIKYTNGTIIHQVKGEEQDGGASQKDKDVVQPFLGYSPSGTEEGELVYANYGRLEDFMRLKKLGIRARSRIAIMRYGKIFPATKIAMAFEFGAKAALLFSDPADCAMEGGEPENTYPNTPWLPASGVQRGSLYTRNGDPQTPGLAALKGMYRSSYKQSKLPPIPAHPMGYGDAIHFLKQIGGPEAPKEWQGSLAITYRLGPGFTDSNVSVVVDVNNKLEVKPIYNVIGTIYGREEPDRYVLIGNHRDSWVYGAIDASTGTAVTTEIARVLGQLKKSGWRPRRTIKICSWGGEEYSIIGSTEWVEQHEKELTERAVIYLNTDKVVAGKYVLIPSASPLVKDTILDFSKTVKDPNAHDDKESIFDIMLERNPSKDPTKPNVGNLGSGSDYAPFYQYVGVPSADFNYIFGYNNTPVFYPVYHSQHDTFNWTKKFVDPDFTLHKAVTQLCGGLLLQFADIPLLKMDAMLYAQALNRSLNYLKTTYKEKLQLYATSMYYLEKAVTQFQETAKLFTTARAQVEKKVMAFDKTSFEELRRLNDQMIKVERAFIYPYGLPGRRLVRHVIFAPSKYNLYASSNFPGISDLLFEVEGMDYAYETDNEICIARQAILAAVDILTPY